MRRSNALLILSLLVVLSAGSYPAWQEYLVLDREPLLRGQVWRLLTGHFVHFGTGHLAVNLAAFAIILGWAWRSGFLRPALLFLLAGCPVLGLLLLLSGADWYAGLSGILHGMLVLLIMRLPIGLRVAGLAVVLVKLLWQFNTGGESALLDLDLPVSQASHWLGLALGMVFHFARESLPHPLDERRGSSNSS